MIKSLRKLADLVGRSDTAVRAWVKRDDWPFSRIAPWPDDQLDAIRDWAAKLQENRAVPVPIGDPITRKLKARLMLARIQKLEAECKQLAARTGEYTLRSDYTADVVRRIHEVKGELLNPARLVASLNPFLTDLAHTAAVDEAIRRWGRDICETFSGQKRS